MQNIINTDLKPVSEPSDLMGVEVNPGILGGTTVDMTIGVTSGLIAKMAVNLLVSMTAPGEQQPLTK